VNLFNGGDPQISGGAAVIASMPIDYGTSLTILGGSSLQVANYETAGGAESYYYSNPGYGADPYAGGAIVQTGGVNSTRGLNIASTSSFNSGSPFPTNGSYSLSGGSLTVSSVEAIGSAGNGIFAQTGGTNTITSGGILYVGKNSGSTGTYSLGATGLLSVAGYWEYVGEGGMGTFNQTGGTNTTPGNLVLGYASGSSGNYSLSGGVLSATTYEDIGYSGAGFFVQTAGTNTTGNFRIGTLGGSTGTYTLSGTGSLTDTSYELLGDYSGSNGNFIQSGGTNTATGLYLGGRSGATGSYNLGGTGALNLSGSEEVGEAGTGTFTQTGGTNTVTGTLTVAADAGSSGTYNMQGGTLAAGAIVVNSGGAFYAGGAGSPVAITLTGAQPFQNQGLTDISIGDPILNGDYTQTDTGETLFELGGPDPNVGYGQLTVYYGTVDLSGVIETDYFNGFYPTIGETFDLIVASDGITLNPDFAGMPEEPGFTYALIDDDTVFQATFTGVVPEPVTGSLLLVASAGMMMRRRRKQVA